MTSVHPEPVTAGAVPDRPDAHTPSGARASAGPADTPPRVQHLRAVACVPGPLTGPYDAVVAAETTPEVPRLGWFG